MRRAFRCRTSAGTHARWERDAGGDDGSRVGDRQSPLPTCDVCCRHRARTSISHARSPTTRSIIYYTDRSLPPLRPTNLIGFQTPSSNDRRRPTRANFRCQTRSESLPTRRLVYHHPYTYITKIIFRLTSV